METDKTGHWSRGKLELVKECPACGSGTPSSKISERRDNEGLMVDSWSMLQCSDCQSLWLSPRPDAQSLPRAYEDYYTHNVEPDDMPQGKSVEQLRWKLISDYLNHRFGMHRMPAARWGHTIFSLIEPWRLKLDYYGRHLTAKKVGKPGRLLDIGCGNGAFLARAADMGWHVQGCEIDPKAVAACRSIGIDILEGDAFHPSLKAQFFNVITMSHVLEHISDQPALLQRIHDLLHPGGWFWLALPNPQSMGLRISGSAWHALHPPYHLCIPSQAVLVGWLEDKGFSDIKLMRRGAHVRNVWKISTTIANREAITTPSKVRMLAWRIIADALSTISPHRADETVILARKPG